MENTNQDYSNLQILIEYPDLGLLIQHGLIYPLAAIIHTIKIGKKIISIYKDTDIEQLATNAIEPFKFDYTNIRSKEAIQESINRSYFHFVDISELAKYNNDSILEDTATEAKDCLDRAYGSLKEK